MISTRKAILANPVTNAIKDARLVELLNPEQARVLRHSLTAHAMICGDRSAALLTVVDPGVISASNRRYQIQVAMLPWKYRSNAAPANCRWFRNGVRRRSLFCAL